MNYYRANFDNDISIKPPEKLPKGLYVLGEFEEYLSLSNIVGVMKRYNGLEAKILRNGRHFIQQEKPDSVNEMIRNFLRKGI